MEQNLVKTNFSLPKWDAKKWSGTIMALVIFGALAFAAYVYLLPFLLSVVWGTIELAVGIPIACFLVFTLFNPKFYRAVGYLSEALAQYTLGWAIELNPFAILNAQVEKAQEDREDLKAQADKLRGQQSKLQLQLEDKDKLMQVAAREVELLKRRIQAKPGDDAEQSQLELSTTRFINAKGYIDKVKPIANDIDKLVLFADKAYKKSGVALQMAKETIEMQRDTFDAVTTGAAAMNRAMKAFTGHTDLNNDAEKALTVLRNDVANKIGTIKSAIQITSEAMNNQDLSDAAKVSLAADTADKFNIDNQLEYSTTVVKSATGLDAEQTKTTGGNKYLDLLK